MLTFMTDLVPVRALWAFFTALIIALAAGSRFIEFCRHHQGKGQPIRESGPQSHLQTKKGTPTMGGLLIIGASLTSALLWCRLDNIHLWSCLFVYLAYIYLLNKRINILWLAFFLPGFDYGVDGVLTNVLYALQAETYLAVFHAEFSAALVDARRQDFYAHIGAVPDIF